MDQTTTHVVERSRFIGTEVRISRQGKVKDVGPAVVPTDMDSRVVLIHALIPLGLQATHA